MPAVTIPDDVPMGAMALLLLLHVPPPVVLVNVAAIPEQILVAPLIVAGLAFIVTSCIAKQPVADSLYVIVAVPADTPVTIPLVVGIVAIAVLLLLHVPPVVVLVRVVAAASQRLADPEMAAGVAATFTAIDRKQPGETVYVIFAAPVATPVTIPVPEPTVAIAELLLDHVPPEAICESVVV